MRLTLLRPDQTPRMGRMLTPEFQEALATALRMIDANDLEGARMHVEHMVADEVKSRYEYAIMRAVLAETYMRTEEGLGKYAPGATAPRNVASRYRLQEPMLSATLRRCIQLDASLGHYYDALNTYLELAGLAKLAPDEPLAHVIRQLEQRLQDDSLLVARVQIGREGFYRHLPYRTVFSVADVQHGTLRTIRARCGKEQRELTPIDGRSWQMPASWKDCELMFLGDAGTQFSVVESTADAGSAGTVIVE